MMTNDTDITEFDLLAYADGRLDPARERLVAAHLQQDPELRAKLDDFARQNADLHAQFDHHAEVDLPRRLDSLLAEAPAGARPARRWMAQAAAVVVAAVTAGAGGWYLGAGSADGTGGSAGSEFLETAAALHASEEAAAEVREVKASEGVWPPRWFSKRISLQLTVPDMRDKGFSLVAKQRIKLDGVKGVRLRYAAENRSQDVFDVFIKSRWTRKPSSVETRRRGDVALAHWLDGPLSVVVAGNDRESAALRELARTLRARLRRDNDGEMPGLKPYGGIGGDGGAVTRAGGSGDAPQADARALTPQSIQRANESRR